MKENVVKGTLAAALAALAAYCRALAAPLAVLMAVMLADYVTGMARAWITRSFSSRAGVRGIVKKVLYLVLVAVGMAADYLTGAALAHAGVTPPLSGMAGLTVTVWLILNELISILENLAESAVPVPAFLLKLILRLKGEKDGETENEE